MRLNTAGAEALADRVALIVKDALGPLVAKCAALETRCTHYEAELAAIGALRERVAVSEARPPLPGPPGPPGPAGRDGVDGLTLDELVATQDAEDERLITLAYRRGAETKTIGVLRLSTPRYCGVYDEHKSYSAGDRVTCKGSEWHCHTPTSARPGDGATGWTLAVKCGRDGKDARP
jgi:hypothetical protein